MVGIVGSNPIAPSNQINGLRCILARWATSWREFTAPIYGGRMQEISDRAQCVPFPNRDFGPTPYRSAPPFTLAVSDGIPAATRTTRRRAASKIPSILPLGRVQCGVGCRRSR